MASMDVNEMMVMLTYLVENRVGNSTLGDMAMRQLQADEVDAYVKDAATEMQHQLSITREFRGDPRVWFDEEEARYYCELLEHQPPDGYVHRRFRREPQITEEGVLTLDWVEG